MPHFARKFSAGMFEMETGIQKLPEHPNAVGSMTLLNRKLEDNFSVFLLLSTRADLCPQDYLHPSHVNAVALHLCTY